MENKPEIPTQDKPKIPIQAIFEAYSLDLHWFANESHVHKGFVYSAYADQPISWTAAEQILKDLSHVTGGIFHLNNTDIKTITHEA